MRSYPVKENHIGSAVIKILWFKQKDTDPVKFIIRILPALHFLHFSHAHIFFPTLIYFFSHLYIFSHTEIFFPTLKYLLPALHFLHFSPLILKPDLYNPYTQSCILRKRFPYLNKFVIK